MIHDDDEEGNSEGAIHSEDLEWLKSDANIFEIKSALRRESGGMLTERGAEESEGL